MEMYNGDHPAQYFDFSNFSWYLNFTYAMENMSHYFDSQTSNPNSGILIQLVAVLDTYCIPVLLSIGLVLNFTLVLTIRLSDLKNVPVCFCLMCLGIVDTLYLIAMWIPWLSKLTVDIYNTRGFCQLTYYLNILTAFLSSWYLVIMMCERVYTICVPNQESKLFSAFRTKCYITFFSIFSIVAHLYLTWTSGVYVFHNASHCMVIFEHMQDIIIMRKIDIIFSFVLPTLLCVAISIAIVSVMTFGHGKDSDREMKLPPSKTTEIIVRNGGVNSSSFYSSVPNNSMKERKHRIRETNRSKRLTYTSIVTVVVYVILTVPHNVLKTKITFSNSDYDVTLQSLYLQILEKIYAVNFVYKAIVCFTLMPEIRRCFVGLLLTACKMLRRNKQNQQHSTAL